MEKVLDIYEKPYNADYPVINFDEKPCQLIDDVVQPLAIKSGQEKREDYHYKRNGTAVVMGAVESLSGKRVMEVRERRTKKDYCRFMQKVSRAYPKAKKIILIQDNLNTHNPSSFYEVLSAEEAFRLANRFEMIYTPKKASWLNMMEIEFSALSKQCLDRRIGNIKMLGKEVTTWTRKRNQKKIKINWQFTKNHAREKVQRFYDNVVKN
jgi:hypothetical protein